MTGLNHVSGNGKSCGNFLQLPLRCHTALLDEGRPEPAHAPPAWQLVKQAHFPFWFSAREFPSVLADSPAAPGACCYGGFNYCGTQRKRQRAGRQMCGPGYCLRMVLAHETQRVRLINLPFRSITCTFAVERSGRTLHSSSDTLCPEIDLYNAVYPAGPLRPGVYNPRRRRIENHRAQSTM